MMHSPAGKNPSKKPSEKKKSEKQVRSILVIDTDQKKTIVWVAVITFSGLIHIQYIRTLNVDDHPLMNIER